jgi:hypothetical protein
MRAGTTCWETAQDETLSISNVGRNRYGRGPDTVFSVAHNIHLSGLDALVTSAPIRDGIIAPMAYREASGWLAFAHAWVDPCGLALRDLDLTGSYAIATRAGRPVLALPNTAGQRAREPWRGMDDGHISIDRIVTGALDVVRSLMRNDGTAVAPMIRRTAWSCQRWFPAIPRAPGSRCASLP